MSTVQVVNKGMRWSQEASDKAKAQHQYIKIGAKSGHLLLTGAPGRWKKNETAGDVYLPGLRVAGNPAVIRNLFINTLRYPAAAIDQHLAVPYTRDNYETSMKANYDAEVAAYVAYRDNKKLLKAAQGGPAVNLSQLQYFVDKLSDASPVARTVTGSPKASSPRTGRVKAIADRLADAVSKGKVLDVSKMDIVKGTGIKMIAPPGGNSKKVGVAGLAIVSSDAGRYRHAVGLLGPNYSSYIAKYGSALPQSTIPPVAVHQTFQPVVTTGLPLATSPILNGGVTLPTAFPGQLPGSPFGQVSPAGSPGGF